ncbi:methane monooxygenase/ammonia monooxygenase subunit C, partial [Nitrosomonas supralitoralis]
MATTYGTTSGAASANYDMSLWYDSKFYKIGMLTMLLV